jgi:murein DD-endopeptidase MepM/ murein hydrolase activator NlpD
MRKLPSSLVIGLVMRASLPACAAPVGTVDGRVPSRFNGETLALVTETRAVPATKTYEVQKGDTLYSLARRFNTSVDKLMADNGIDSPEKMLIGAELVVGPRKPMHKEPTKIAKVDPKPKGSLKRTDARTKYGLAWPVAGSITSRYGHRSGRNHDGIDIAAKEGAPVQAAADGEVLFAANKGGYGNLILVRHANGLITVYAHNQANLVRPGQRVRAGQTIAKVGKTGRATGPHLHFEVRRGVKPENPLGHLPP